MEEIWKDIEGYEGLYQVSNLGNVRSSFYLKTYKITKIKLLKPEVTNVGYLRVCLVKNNLRYRYSIHRLVVEAFIGKINDGLQVNHINGVKTDNRVENLEIITQAENIRHSYKINLHKPRLGEVSNNHKLDNDIIFEIRKRFKMGENKHKLASYFGVCRATIRNIINRKTWKHI